MSSLTVLLAAFTALAGAGLGFWFGFLRGRRTGRLELRLAYEQEHGELQREFARAREAAERQREKQRRAVESRRAQEWLDTWQ